MSSFQNQIQLLTVRYKAAKRCNDYLRRKIPFEAIELAQVKNALDALEFVTKYNAQVDALIEEMYRSCENRFMIDRVRLMKLTQQGSTHFFV